MEYRASRSGGEGEIEEDTRSKKNYSFWKCDATGAASFGSSGPRLGALDPKVAVSAL